MAGHLLFNSGSNESSLAPQFKWLDNTFKWHFYGIVQLHNDGFCNGCITKRIEHWYASLYKKTNIFRNRAKNIGFYKYFHLLSWSSCENKIIIWHICWVMQTPFGDTAVAKSTVVWQLPVYMWGGGVLIEWLREIHKRTLYVHLNLRFKHVILTYAAKGCTRIIPPQLSIQ